MRSDSEIFLSEVLDTLNAAYLKTPRHMRFVVEAHIDALAEELMLQAEEQQPGNPRAS
jgi:hypothetical protein